MIQQKNIALCIILSIVTCGIYGLIWFVKLTDETNMLAPPSPDGKQGEKLDNAKAARGLPTSNQSVIYLILQLFVPIAGWALMQNQINEMAPPPQQQG